MLDLRIQLFFLSALISLSCIRAQDVENASETKRLKLSSDFQVGMVAGGQVVNEQFIYKPGVIGQFSVNAEVSPWIHAGIGLAIQSLEDETILPLFVDIKAQFKEGDRASFLGLNIGTSTAWSDYYRNVSDFEYEGGFYFSTYYSFQFPLSDKVNFILATGFIHQIGEIEFYTEFDEKYEEDFAMDFISIRAGIRFK